MIYDLIVCDKARIPVIWFCTYEELRAERALYQYASNNNGKVWIWSITSGPLGTKGWQCPEGTNQEKPPFDEQLSTDAVDAVSSVINYAKEPEHTTEKHIIVIRDPHYFLQKDAAFSRILRDAAYKLRGTLTSIVCISPEDELPTELRKDIEVIRPGLPDKEVMKAVISEQISHINFAEEYTEEFIDKVSEACCGLTLTQATDAISESFAKFGKKIDISYINERKTQRISSIPGLTYIGETPSLSDNGGMAGLKEYHEDRKFGFTQEARDFGLPTPRGILLAGVSGCGKSLFAKSIASELDMPLILLKMADVKGGIVGQTESNWRQVTESVEAIGQCVIWLDELEKSLPKAGEHNSDGGTSDALLHGMLHWMQERPGGAYFIATANNISALPPELLRKGRWDAIFFVDLPNEEERADIVKIHLQKVNRMLSEESIQEIAKKTEGRSGAEIEAGVIDGLWVAFSDNRRDLTADDIIDCIEMDVPLSQTMKGPITELREWAQTNARMASTTRKRKQQVTLEIREEEDHERRVSN